MHPAGSREAFRFGDFELDVAGYELRRHGRPVKLGRQPMDLLILLVEGRGQLVSRSDIVDHLWGKDVFVDVETGVNTTISKIRQVLRDSVDAPAIRGDGAWQGLSIHRRRRDGHRFHRSRRPRSASPSSPEGGERPQDGTVRRRTGDGDGRSFVPVLRRGSCTLPLASPRGTSGARPSRAVGLVVVAAIFGVLAWMRRRRRASHGCGRRRAAVREPRERSRARLRRRRTHRRDQRVARADRSRALQRQGAHASLQRHDEDRCGDRTGARRRLPRRELGPSRGRPAASHRDVDTCTGSGARVVCSLTSVSPPACSGFSRN